MLCLFIVLWYSDQYIVRDVVADCQLGFMPPTLPKLVGRLPLLLSVLLSSLKTTISCRRL